jgi:hypothetical protein
MEARNATEKKGLSMTPDYFQPLLIAATILKREQHNATLGKSCHAIVASSESGWDFEVGLKDRPLFLLSVSGRGRKEGMLWSPFGQASLDLEKLSQTQPDPLWESADGICSHMEDDHADTFTTFLSQVGRDSESDAPEQALGMPWVQTTGFFLATTGQYVFLPFPTPCPDANSVRARLIKMLRKARDARG